MSSWRGWNWDDGNFGGSGLEPLHGTFKALAPFYILLAIIGTTFSAVAFYGPDMGLTVSPTMEANRWTFVKLMAIGLSAQATLLYLNFQRKREEQL